MLMYIYVNVITDPCPKSNGGLIKSPLNLGYGRVIKSDLNNGC